MRVCVCVCVSPPALSPPPPALATAAASEFVRVGDSAVAAAGDSDFADATGGDFPHGNRVVGNHFRGVGVYGKQASAYFQTLACRNTVSGNVMYEVSGNA